MIKKLSTVFVVSLMVVLSAVGCSTETGTAANGKSGSETAQAGSKTASLQGNESVSALLRQGLGKQQQDRVVKPDFRSAKNHEDFVFDPEADYGSLWNSELFNDSRFKLDIRLTKQEMKEAKTLARSFEAHMARSTMFMHYLLSELKKRNMPVELAALPLVESGFKMRAKSHAGARGPWQFTRQTGKSFGLEVSGNYDEFYDFVASTDASLKYLQHLYEELDHNWDLAVAAYNQGEFGIKRAVRRARAAGVKNINRDTVPMTAHAKMYVRRFRCYAEMLRHPENFGVKRPEIENRPAFRGVKIAGRISSMRKAAYMSGVKLSVLQNLNSGYLSDTLKSNRQRMLLVPVENAERLERAIGIITSEQVAAQVLADSALNRKDESAKAQI